MNYAEYFRKLARRCRVLSKTAVDPELIDQMRVWAIDFADEADKMERRAVTRDRHLMTWSACSSDRVRGLQPGGRYTTSESRDDRPRRWHR
jgi:hypothetical protein